MKTTTTFAAINNNIDNRSQFSVALVLGGIVTAIICALALLHDSYSTGNSVLPKFFESSSVSTVNALVTSASTLISSLGDAVTLATTSLNPSLLSF